MGLLTSSSCGGNNRSWHLARQWYSHTAGIFLMWNRLAAPWALLAAWLSTDLRPLVVAPLATLVYPAAYMVLRQLWRVPLRHLKAADTTLLVLSTFGPARALGTGNWLWLPAAGLFLSAWYINWWHKGSDAPPGQGSLPAAPPFLPPVSGPVTAGYRSYDQTHTGIDFGVPPGTAIVAPAEAVVLHAGPLEQWGYAVLLDHGGGWTTLYAHLEGCATRRGAKVMRSDIIGWSGTTGISTGPHVHVELRYRDAPVDPAPLLAQS